MNVRIEKVILWHQDTAQFPPRVIDFSARPVSRGIDVKKGSVHLILGHSGTGKTALLHVIDYCLGADRSSIPMERPYRELIQWYGMIIRVQGSKLYLIARGTPSGGLGDKYCFEALNTPNTPDWLLEPNMGREQFLVAFGQLLGMDMELYSDQLEGVAAEDEILVTPHDLTPFLLMPADYHIRADGLFYTRHVGMAALRRAMPLALGAVTRDAVVFKIRQTKLKRQVAANRRKYEDMLEIAGGIQQTLTSTYTKAVELGLIAIDDPTRPTGSRAMLAQMEQMYQTLSESGTSDTSTPIMEQLRLLRVRERNVRRRLTALTRQLNEVHHVLQLTDDANTTMTGSAVRLRAFDWFQEHAKDSHSCPVCGSAAASAQVELTRIGKSIEQHRSEVGAVLGIDAEYRSRESEIVQALSEARTALDQALSEKLRISALLNVDGKESQVEVSLAQIERLFAGTEAVLASRFPLERLDTVQAAYEQSRDELARTERQLDVFATQSPAPERVASVREHIESHAKNLVLSHTEDDIQFSLETLDLQFGTSSTGSKPTRIKIKQTGGAANWMGYNIAVHLALHDRFASEPDSPVPSFLVIDQFSVAEANRTVASETQRSLTQRVFDALAHFARVQDVQIIVLTSLHDENLWSPYANEAIVHVERWESTQGAGLIPADWLE